MIAPLCVAVVEILRISSKVCEIKESQALYQLGWVTLLCISALPSWNRIRIEDTSINCKLINHPHYWVFEFGGADGTGLLHLGEFLESGFHSQMRKLRQAQGAETACTTNCFFHRQKSRCVPFSSSMFANSTAFFVLEFESLVWNTFWS